MSKEVVDETSNGRFSDADDEGGEFSSNEILSGPILNSRNNTATTNTNSNLPSFPFPSIPLPATANTNTILNAKTLAVSPKKFKVFDASNPVNTAKKASTSGGETSGADADDEAATSATRNNAVDLLDDDYTNDDDANTNLDIDDGGEDDFGFSDERDSDEYDDEFDLQDQDVLDYGDQWHNATGDFTKQFNKMRSQIAAASTANTVGAIIPPSNNATAHGKISAAAAKARVAASNSIHQNFKQPVTSMVSEKALIDELSAKFASKIRIDPLQLQHPSSLPLTSSVQGDMKVSSRKAEGDKTIHKDKADRATVEQVLDPRTRIILFKLLNNQTLAEVNGCISTGKEANVYHATTPDGLHRAIKVYKTSILVFKDRDKYVSGEFRFRHGYAKSNPRKMVKVWAEKEMRNLKRLTIAGICCPEPILLRMHVLVMGFLGDKNGWASPRLKDAVINDPMIYKNLYIHLVKQIWKMYHKCKLVHADLSEYNILYHNKTLYIIDVSQSVEHDHPHALEFLRKDLQNVVEYFSKRVPPQSPDHPDSVNVFTLRELFDYTITPLDVAAAAISMPYESGEDAILDAYTIHMHSNSARTSVEDAARKTGVSVDAARAEAAVAEAVFKQTFIPRTLQDVVDFERDIEKATKTVNAGGVVEAGAGVGVYAKVTGLILENITGGSVAVGLPATVTVSVDKGKKIGINSSKKDTFSEENDEDSEGQDSEDDDSEAENESDEEDSDNENAEASDYEERKANSRLKKDEERELKKARQQAAKEEKREKRKTKMPKAVKKRKQKVSSSDKKK
ncbi:Serine/threonine-protein kinase RIO1 [Physocladia obscura]|uniref:Serine/threonine-protein kinase RIO1 n=1 Tax=Physocladia obscura TaxID=109957 RepID=A0AAD5SXX0_9FUNG|nr:Serine/threonine-protein kinase RIO1 [Physocladia obscura]